MPSVNPSHFLLLTGVSGVGKTTVIRKVAMALRQQHHIGDLYTEEMREAGTRKGFRLTAFNQHQGVIAHEGFDSRKRVGKYGVDVATIGYLAAGALISDVPIEIYLIDEIGKMECLSDIFVERTLALLTSEGPLIATVAKQGGGLIEMVKQWPGSELWEITRANRDSLVEEILQWIDRRL